MHASRRLHPRIEAPITVNVGGVSGHLLDLSQGGCRFLAATDDMNGRLAPGDLVDCQVELPSSPRRALLLAAQVIRRATTPAGVELAARFIDPDNDSRSLLARFIDQTLSDALTAAERARTAFLHGMSHEIRTPLNAVIGFSQLGLASADLQPKQSSYFADIHHAGEQMLEFLDSLLTLASCEADATNSAASPRPERLAPLLVGAVIATATTAKREAVTVRADMPQDNPIAVVRLEHLREILNGLVRGAIAEAGANGEVVLGYRINAGGAHIDIRVQRAADSPQRQDADHAAWNGSGGGSAMAALYLTAVNKLAEALGMKVRRLSEAGDSDAIGFELSLPAPMNVIKGPGRLAS